MAERKFLIGKRTSLNAEAKALGQKYFI